jgi:hypothetical protein
MQTGGGILAYKLNHLTEKKTAETALSSHFQDFMFIFPYYSWKGTSMAELSKVLLNTVCTNREIECGFIVIAMYDKG